MYGITSQHKAIWKSFLSYKNTFPPLGFPETLSNFYNSDAYALYTANRHIRLLKQISCFLRTKYQPRPVCWTSALAAFCSVLTSDPASKFLPRWITRLLRYFDAQQVAQFFPRHNSRRNKLRKYDVFCHKTGHYQVLPGHNVTYKQKCALMDDLLASIPCCQLHAADITTFPVSDNVQW